MKYIKEYKEIDWDDWDEEEKDPNGPPDTFKGHEKFYKFLKQHNAVNNFIEEYYRQNFYLGTPKKLYDFLQEYKPKDMSIILMDGIDWHESQLGVDYWYDLIKKLKYL